MRIGSEGELVALTLALGAGGVGGPLSDGEVALAAAALGIPADPRVVEAARAAIAGGGDPLGDAFSVLRSPERRRESGATYTPALIVESMMDWAASTRRPDRVVDPGVGSGRFLAAAARAFPQAELVGIDVDPLATMMARANLAVLGQGSRARIVVGDFREFDAPIAGTTLYVGNPPYVRHHQIGGAWKDWLGAESANLRLPASKLAGLHVYFFLAAARRAKPGDFGAFITAAEWLDVNYGSLVRALMLDRLGGQSVTVIDPTAQPFPDAASTAAIATFDIGNKPSAIYFRRADKLADLGKIGTGRPVFRDRLATEARWSHLTRSAERPRAGYVELGEICRVHRGTVTGANGVWIAGSHSAGLPESLLFPTITKAREVLEADGLLADPAKLRRVINLPADLDELDGSDRRLVEKFLVVAKAMGGSSGYIARHRKAWWAVGLRAAAPILSTYMARRPPGFVINKADARHINIAHGLYPREPLGEAVKGRLVAFLQTRVSQGSGRTYAGGLTKFEPREMERLIVPGPELLATGDCL